MSLHDLRLGFCYDTGPDNLAEDFYVPCLAESINYDRAVGFFSSSVFEISWKGLRKFLSNDGKIRLVCSNVLQVQDAKKISSSLAQPNELLEAELIDQIESMMKENRSKAALQVLGYLIQKERLKIKIAIPQSALVTKSLAIFHSKTGIFEDKVGNTVVFKGSSNESKGAFSKGGNAETVDVFCSWINKSEQKRVSKAKQDFERLWDKNFEGLSVFDFPEAVRQQLIRISSEDLFEKALSSLEQDEEFLFTEVGKQHAYSTKPKYELSVTLREHQERSIKEWVENNHRGLMKHATGSGKTITGIAAAVKCLNVGMPTIVLVPSKLLLIQWESEIKKFIYPSPPLLICGDGNVSWKNGNLNDWISEPSNTRMVLATVSTASSEEFREQLLGNESWALIADEVHRLGSTGASTILTLKPERRLGLSATPERTGDSIGTKDIFDFFGDVLPTTFGLRDAIRLGVLTPYHYSIKPVELTDDEMNHWISLSRRIAILASSKEKSESSASIERLLIERFRIVKGATNKLSKAVEIIRDRYSSGDRWIVYCDTIEQIGALYESLIPSGITVSKYYSSMDGDPAQTLKFFEKVGGVILSVRCLDEGVDIPAASHALLIASSQNPREFVQRRGRVLRKSKGKTISYICDLVTLPSADCETEEAKSSAKFILAELSRAILFSGDAINANAAADIERIAKRYDLELTSSAQYGVESDIEEEFNE